MQEEDEECGEAACNAIITSSNSTTEESATHAWLIHLFFSVDVSELREVDECK